VGRAPVAGNILGEATTSSGNIFNNAMRHPAADDHRSPGMRFTG